MELAQTMTPSPEAVCSVCIANYNGLAVIDACIQSVLLQDCGFPVEIIVHDDASTDGSVDYIRTNYPDVILITSESNVGFCISNNRMVDIALGQYILLLNNDAELFPDALSSLHAAAQETSQAVLGLPQYDAATGDLIDIGSKLDPFLNPIPNQDATRNEVGMIIGACLWLPRSLWKDLGGFPTWFGSLAEDMYLCCLARLGGHPVSALSHSGFKHWVGYSLGGGKVIQEKLSTKASRRILSERNKTFVMYLTYPAPFLQLLLPLHLALLLAEGLILTIVKRDWRLFSKIYLGCMRALWDHREHLVQQRRRIQAKRQCGRFAYFKPVDWIPHKLRLLLQHGMPEIK